MPELPEVETMVRDLRTRVLGRTITFTLTPFAGSIIWPATVEFQRRVTSRSITGLSRRGKYALIHLDSDDVLVIHRGMSGSLLLREPEDPMESHVRVLFALNDAHLRFNDPRKFGKIWVMRADGEDHPLPWRLMGPEPFDETFSPRALAASLGRRRAPVKVLLLNQHIVAGLGNIYVDEALHLARVHPERRGNTLTPDEIKRLHTSIQRVLSQAIEGRGTTFSSYTDIEGRHGRHQNVLQVFHRTGQPCSSCGTTIIKMVVGGRGTHICPDCQPVSPCPC